MMQCTLDWAVYYKNESGNIIRLFATYVDHTLHGGNAIYEKLLEKTEKKFNCKVRSWDSM